LEFSKAFQFEECASEKGVNPHEGGGRIVNYKGKLILLSVGSYGINKLPQDNNSIFGKIIAIDIDSGKHKIVSMGHRNPQGLYYDEAHDVIISTEHGPNGGDEININKIMDGQFHHMESIMMVNTEKMRHYTSRMQNMVL